MVSSNILVVGGSSGVGFAVAKLALRQLPFANIIISSSNEAKLKAAADELNASKPTDVRPVDFVVCDASNLETQTDDIESLLQTATSRFNGPVNHIIWTAAGGPPQMSAGDRSAADMISTATTRTFGPMALAYLAKQYMAVDKSSSITITSGISLRKPMPGRARGIAAAGGLEAGARGLALDLAPIRVNSVALGPIKTPLFDKFIDGNIALATQRAETTVLKCIGTAEEAAEAYIFCMRCGYVTGSRIDVDGGALLL